jgi:phospholipase C
MQRTRKEFLKSMAGATVAGGLSAGITQTLAAAREVSGAKPRQARIADVQVLPFTI